MATVLERPSYEELLASSEKAHKRIAKLEKALEEVSDLGIAGVWPAWEMGSIARKALGPKGERRHAAVLRAIPDYY